MAGERKPRFLPALVILLIILRWCLGTLPGYEIDLLTYKQWALTAGGEGIHTIYDHRPNSPYPQYDYPPLYAYLLAPIGQFYCTIASPQEPQPPSATAHYADSPTFSLLVKLPAIACDFLIALLLGLLAFRFGLWPRGSWRGWLPALLFLFLPPVLIDSAYWGQPDSIHTFLLLMALTLILVGKPELGGISAALGCLMKPLALPYLPLLALATLVGSGWRRLLTAGLAGAGTIVAGFLPFLVTGRGRDVLERLVSDLDLMPFTSVNAHNLWWLLAPWHEAHVPVWGPITPTMIGLFLFGVVYVLILWRLWLCERSQHAGRPPIGRGPLPLSQQRHWFLATALVAYAFFAFSTHMHENHLFTALPFLMILAGGGPRWLAVCLIGSLSIFINMANHDVQLGNHVLRHIGGSSEFYHFILGRCLSSFEFRLANINSILTLAILGFLLALGYRLSVQRRLPSADR
ncbi:MAG: DUF2029 domain-containing protein [Candidatus Eisenbacteria sp.]|nr:DUF2029 domain-containing protein [Candidatus Eisenbacteria bacterium]